MSSPNQSVKNFLFEEARLLDRHALGEWMALLTPTVRYRVEVQEVACDEKFGEMVNTNMVLDEDWQLLKVRADRILKGWAWAEAPRSLTTRLVGNLRIAPAAGSDAVDVDSTVLVWQWSVVNGEGRMMGCQRADRLVPSATGGWQIGSRVVTLGSDQVVGGALTILL